MLGDEPARELLLGFVRDRPVIRQHEVGAVAWQGRKARARRALPELVALALKKRRQVQVVARILQKAGQRPLNRRVAREYVELMTLGELGHQFNVFTVNTPVQWA